MKLRDQIESPATRAELESRAALFFFRPPIRFSADSAISQLQKITVHAPIQFQRYYSPPYSLNNRHATEYWPSPVLQWPPPRQQARQVSSPNSPSASAISSPATLPNTTPRLLHHQQRSQLPRLQKQNLSLPHTHRTETQRATSTRTRNSRYRGPSSNPTRNTRTHFSHARTTARGHGSALALGCVSRRNS